MGKIRSSQGGARSGNSRKGRKRRFFKLKWLMYLFILGLILLGVGYFVFQFKTQPFKDKAAEYDLSMINDVEVVSLILDRKGRELGRIFVENRDVISIKDVPQTMVNALVSGEDQRFFEHDGVDRQGVLRAVWLNFKAGRQTQGASTLTQQLARNAFHLKEEADEQGWSGIERKAVEAFLAQRIEKRYSKSEILEFYLNRVPFGSGFYGIRSASLGYFGKEPQDLTVSECASLVGCIKNPTKISPLNNLEMNKKARNQVLKRMAAEGFLSDGESAELQEKEVVINPKPLQRGASHLYERIASDVRKRLGEDAMTQGGFTIHTTIDLDVQKAMEASLLKSLATAESVEGYDHPKYESYRREDGKPDYLQGAGLMMDNRSGAVIAYVGGRDFTHNQFDIVQLGRKPIGTAFFPFIYTAALEQKMSAASLLLDAPMNNRAIMLDGREGVLGEWGMEILHPQYEGEITMRRALEVSKIGASVRLGKSLGLGTVMETARKFGLTFPETKLLTRMLVGTDQFSLPDMVRAYSAFPNGGRTTNRMFMIDRIIDSSGSVRYQASKQSASDPILDEQTSFVMHSMLQSSLKSNSGGEGAPVLTDDPSLAGKTGTTYDFADNWYVGYNSQVTCAVWAGFLHGRRDPIYPGAFSRETVFPVWAASMNAAASEFRGQAIETPDGLVSLEICRASGLRKTKYCQEYKRNPVTGKETYASTAFREYFIEGTAPSGYCDVHGVVDGTLAKNYDFSADGTKASTSRAIPIQPKAPLLLGNDPYGTEQPDFVPRDAAAVSRGAGIVNFDQLDAEDKDAAIILDRPRRVSIQED
ncbi:transglycosylase domain-containing protein [Verrucomicrobiaceae bacterium R5-34]|nr:transglycosylase domain-containing protein [Verrucomicrobiaceae bacterium R5-34]